MWKIPFGGAVVGTDGESSGVQGRETFEDKKFYKSSTKGKFAIFKLN